MNVTKKYLYFYSPEDFTEMKPAVEDVFYENKGRVYTQFHKGDLLPIEVYNAIFGEKESEPKTKSQVEEVKVQESDEVEENQEESESTKKESKPRKRRQKSIIDK